MQAEDSCWLKKKQQNPKQKKNNKRKGVKNPKQNKKKVPEVACKDFPFTEEGPCLRRPG